MTVPGAGVAQVPRDGGTVTRPAYSDVVMSSVQEALPGAQPLPGTEALQRTAKGQVGRELGKERMQVHRWLKRYSIDIDAYRS